MLRNVIIEIKGQQTMGKEKDETLVCAKGTYHKKKELHCIEYDETPEEGITIHNVISASDRGMKITKTGGIASDMLFIPGKKKEMAYKTPYGIFAMETDCRRLSIEETEERLAICAEYELSTDGELVSECMTEVTVTFEDRLV